MQIIVRNSLRSCLFLAGIFLVTGIFRLGALPFTGSDEPRYARISQEMQQQGRWVTPVLEGLPWLEKPPLYYWITIPFYAAFGVGETTARLGPALSGLLAVLAVFWLGSRWWSRLEGLCGALLLLTCLGWVGFGRSASTDMPMTACLTVALAVLGAAAQQDGLSTAKLFCGYAFLGLAVLAKGPVALVLAAGTGLLFWALDERGGSVTRWRLLPGLAVTAAVALPWFWLAFRQNGFSFVSIFFLNHHLARYITDIHHHTEPIYYFIPVLFGLLLPWSAWMVLLVPRAPGRMLRRWKTWDRKQLLLACWALFPVVFFSLSSSKLAGYVLPAVPPLALLIGMRLARWARGSGEGLRTTAAAWLHLLLSAGLAVAIPVAFQRSFGGNWGAGLALSAATLIPAIPAFRYALLDRGGAAFKALVIQALVLILSLTQFAFPSLARYHSTREIAQQMQALRLEGEPAVAYRFFHHTLHYYSGYRLSADLPDHDALVHFAAEHKRFLLVTETVRSAEISALAGFSATLLGEQGKLRLFRMGSLAGADFPAGPGP